MSSITHVTRSVDWLVYETQENVLRKSNFMKEIADLLSLSFTHHIHEQSDKSCEKKNLFLWHPEYEELNMILNVSILKKGTKARNISKRIMHSKRLVLKQKSTVCIKSNQRETESEEQKLSRVSHVSFIINLFYIIFL